MTLALSAMQAPSKHLSQAAPPSTPKSLTIVFAMQAQSRQFIAKLVLP